MHDEIATDKNHPTVNANGKVYAVSAGHGQLVMVDPKEHSTVALDIPTRAPRADVPSRFPKPNRPSLFWGTEHLWANPPYNPADPHNPMIDSKGRVWMTSKIRPNPDPAWCSDPSNRFAEWFPLRQSGRQASFYDPKTQQFTLIDTCYSTHHLQFDNDANETRVFQRAHRSDGRLDRHEGLRRDARMNRKRLAGAVRCSIRTATGRSRSRGINGRRRGPVSWRQRHAGGGGRTWTGGPLIRSSIRRSATTCTASSRAPSTLRCGESRERYPGYLVRMERGTNAPSSCKSLVFKVPEPGFDPRGVDIDSNGVVWTALAASSHLASFDFRKCRDVSGPAKADGSQCREGWTLYRTNGPKLKGTEIPADFHYYNWVDQHNISGLGANTPFATGSNSDSLLALNPQTRMDHAARPLSARLLLARHGRPHRRSERRMERPRLMGELRHALRLAHRRRQGHQGQAGALSAATGSVGEIIRKTRPGAGRNPVSVDRDSALRIL